MCHERQVPGDAEDEFRRLYDEIAGSANPPAIATLTKLAPVSQMLFGSDHRWGRVGATLDGLRNLGLSTANVRAIERGNALTLFPRLNG